MNDTTDGVVSFRRSYPLDFSLHDDDDQHVLYIDDDPMGRSLHLEIRNASPQTITVPPLPTGAANAERHHFELRFRPGTLSTASLNQVTLAENGWSVSPTQQPDGTVSLYLLSTNGQAPLGPSETLRLTLQHVSAATGSGSRGTRVELRYQQLRYSDDSTPRSGSRVQHLNVINQRGRRNIPLHLGFVGSNMILNDGTSANAVTVRLTNVLREGAITFNPADSQAPTRFTLSFDVQPSGENRDWALGTSSQVQAIEVAVRGDGWDVHQEVEGETPQWMITPKTPMQLELGAFVQFDIANIISSLPSGHTHLYLHYANVPGYWDGQLVVGMEKGPLVYRGENVGIGTASPAYTIDVRGYSQLTDSGGQYNSHFPFTNHQAYVSGEKVHLRGGQPQGNKIALTVDGASGRVGIGTVNPDAALHIFNRNQDANGNTLILGPTSQSHLRLGYDQEYSWVQSHGSKPLAINPLGNQVGIGTSTPQAALHIRGSREVTLTLQSAGTDDISGKLSLHQSDTSGADIYYNGRNAVEGLQCDLRFRETSGSFQATTILTPLFISNRSTTRGHIGIGGITNPEARVDINAETHIGLRLTTGSTNENWTVQLINQAQPGFRVGMRLGNDGFFYVSNNINSPTPRSARLDSTGNWSVSSDSRLKRHLAPVTGVLDKAMALKPRRFCYANQDRQQMPHDLLGFISQEVEPVFPHLVSGDEVKYLNYSGFGVIAIASLQELKQAYDARLAVLEQWVQQLRRRLEKRRDQDESSE